MAEHSSPPPSAAGARRGFDAGWRSVRSSTLLAPVFFAIVLFVANVVLEPSFVNRENWATTLSVMCPFVLTAVAAAVPILSGNAGIDLSIGPFAGFVTVLVAQVLAPAGLGSAVVLLPIVVGFGFVAGGLNGFLVGVVRLPPIIATLGTYLLYSGVASEVLPTPGGTVPGWVVHANASYGPVPGILVVFVVIAVAWTAFSRTVYLRNLLATGCDERTAYTTGVNVAAVRVLAYCLSGVFAALAGLFLLGLLQSGDATVGPPYTISALTAVALGGVNLAGGRGRLAGAAVGGVVLYLIQSLLTSSGVSVYELNIANGLILVIALGLNVLLPYLTQERRGRSRPIVVPAIDAAV